ncbi:NlpC/P60 family peptidoglycan endopeptidase RipA [Mycolicibacterium fortuitum]
MRPGRYFLNRAVAAIATVVTVVGSSPVALASPDAVGQRDEATLASLVTAVAEADQQLAGAAAAIQQRQESVNKALVELAHARENAESARRDADSRERALADAGAAITSAQQRFDDAAAATYIHGPSTALLSASRPEDLITAVNADRELIRSHQTVLARLQRARTTAANLSSAARAAQQRAATAVSDAERSQQAAIATLTEAQTQFRTQQIAVDRLATARAHAQERLDAQLVSKSRPAAATTAAGGDTWDRAPTGRPDAGQWDTTLPMVPSANVAGDPVAIINAVLQISATSAQVTAQMGRTFLTSLGILPKAAAPADPGFTNGRIPRVYGRQASEYVIRRATAQLGVPYSWGGGNASGPSRGIDQGANTVGFDCSGLMLYAFAGVGIKLDHYSGSQYNAGRKIPSSQMRRGDLIFYGPDASQHEAMYLGDGQMLEAPFTGSQVRIAPVRSSGMMPYVTRLIEY